MTEYKITIEEFCNRTVEGTARLDDFREWCKANGYALKQYPSAWRKGWKDFMKERESNEKTRQS